MSLVPLILIFVLFGVLLARQPDIDINRVKLIPRESAYTYTEPINRRRSINFNHNSGRFADLRPPVLLLDTPSASEAKGSHKIHQPREDPRLFYQSDAYLKEVHRKNLNNDLSAIYPDGIVRAGDNYRARQLHVNSVNYGFENYDYKCIRCPHDRTLIAKAGTDQVLLQQPRLLTCNGHKAPRKVHFIHMFGPKFGSLIQQGSHIIIGRVMIKGQIVQTCKMQVHVIMQTCPIPKYLIPHCSKNETTCNFSCRDAKLELHGITTLECKGDMQWTGQLPVCKARTWCEPPSPPDHGRLSCKGATAGNGYGLLEGASCRVRCAQGYKWNPRATAVCRREYTVEAIYSGKYSHIEKNMGNNASRSENETTASIKNDLEGSSNPDPRSPTPEIVRTPIQNGTNGGKHITKNVDLRKTFEDVKGDEKLIRNNPILSAVIKNHLQSYDPRSPSQDFERTPIILPSKISDIESDLTNDKLMLQNDNCASPMLLNDDKILDSGTIVSTKISPDLIVPKNLCHDFYDLSLNDSLKESAEPLGSSTASNEAIEENISKMNEGKPTILLETNFEYVDNNDEQFKDSQVNNEDVLETKCTSIYKILENDPRSPSLGIERTPIVVTNIGEDTSEGNVEDMSDDTLIKVLQTANAELKQTLHKPSGKNTEELLIYEDEMANIDNTPKKSMSISNKGDRTPLSCMKNKSDPAHAHARSKSVNTLYVPKSQMNRSKIPKRASYIPRLKALSRQPQMTTMSSISLKNISKTSAINGDCENTPPHSHRDKWDKDGSIVL